MRFKQQNPLSQFLPRVAKSRFLEVVAAKAELKWGRKLVFEAFMLTFFLAFQSLNKFFAPGKKFNLAQGTYDV